MDRANSDQLLVEIAVNMSAEIVLRKAKTEDLPSIVRICALSVALLNAENNYQWNDTYPLQSDFEKDIHDDVLWVAEVNGDVAGFAALTTDQSEEYAELGWKPEDTSLVPHRVAVDPAFRGKGIARKFMIKAEELAREAGYKYVRVDTNIKNLVMQGLFKSLGYEYGGEVCFKNKPIIYEKMRFPCYQKILDYSM
eukprot:gene8513-10098_t